MVKIASTSVTTRDCEMPMHVLIIEDNRDILANLYQYFEALGYRVDSATDGLSGLALATHEDFDVIVLDLRLPRLDGLDLCQRLRQVHRRNTPVLMLTARDALEDKIAGFESGADDYMVKPFELSELDARLKALVRRAQGLQHSAVLQYADVTLDLETYEAYRGGHRLDLPPIGFRILAVLMKAAPRVVAKLALEREIWGDEPPETDALRSHVYALRQALDKPYSVSLLHTVHGVGYKLMRPDSGTVER